ncbi:MAG: squalene/phytoene synthase family protein [Pseudomonadota bacterium]
MNARSTTSLDAAAKRENFPVASRLLSPPLRSRVVAFYRYARTADDIADDPALGTVAKLDGLQALEDGLRGLGPDNSGTVLRRALDGSGNGRDAEALAAARDLLTAFRRDAEGIACADWADLMSYCDASAVPVGRFLLAIHGEDARSRDPSDALCAALQVLNHLQDLKADWVALERRYLPADWMVACGATDADLARDAATPELRAAIDRTLDATDDLIARAAPLPGAIAARGLRAQAAATLDVARRLSARLRRADPLAGHVALRRGDLVRVTLAGLWALR